jgi:DNA-binding CsgD family transcriptional regulator
VRFLDGPRQKEGMDMQCVGAAGGFTIELGPRGRGVILNRCQGFGRSNEQPASAVPAKRDLAPIGWTPAGGGSALAAVLVAVLGRLDRGVLILDRTGGVVFANPCAQITLIESRAMTLVRGQLALQSASSQARLEQFLKAGRCAQSSEQLLIRAECRARKAPLWILVTPLHSAGDLYYEVAIHDPLRARQVSASDLRRWYELTPTEARLLARMSAGASLREVAKEMDITLNTARSHLKRLFAKCGVRSQAALLQLVALGPR